MSKNQPTVFDFADESETLPSKILLDASILLYVVVDETDKAEKQAIFDDAKNFLKRLEVAASADTCSPLAPLHIVTECFHFITRKAIRAYATANKQYVNNKRVTSWEVVYKNDPELIEKLDVSQKLEGFLAALETLGVEIIQPEDLAISSNTSLETQIIRYMRELHLLAADAHTLAIADRLEVRNVASLDQDFLRITQASFNLYTSPAIS